MSQTVKISRKVAQNLLQLIDGEKMAYTRVKHRLIDELIDENLLLKTGKGRYRVQAADADALLIYLQAQWQIQSLPQLVDLLAINEVSRADATRITTDSKYAKSRVFKGFLVNSYQPIATTFKGAPLTIAPPAGTFQFIYDYEDFVPDAAVTIVGVENAENFRQIHAQRQLFSGIQPLFLSRYPQSQHKDVIRWLTTLPNRYLHFGDIDLAGIAIYLREYQAHLGSRARFFIPPNIARDLVQFGNRARYDKQVQSIDMKDTKEEGLRDLIALIQREKKGLDQEFYIQET